MTYKELVDRIEDAVVRHKMLTDFGYGQLSDIKVLDNSEDGADYPYAFLLPGPVARTGQSVTYNFSLIVMEMAITPREILQVQSDCIQYINDLVADLRFDTTFSGDINLSQSVQVFRERFQDEVAGATLNLQITVADVIDQCTAPVEPAVTELVHATNLSTQTIGSEVGEDRSFAFPNEIVDIDDSWSINRWTAQSSGSYRFEVRYSFQFETLEPGETYPTAPQLRYFPVGGGQQYIPATTETGWPTTPAVGVTYTVYQEWDLQQRDAGDFEFVYMEDQPGDQTELLVDADASIKIYKYA